MMQMRQLIVFLTRQLRGGYKAEETAKLQKIVLSSNVYVSYLDKIQCICIHGIFDNEDVHFQGRNDNIIFFANHQISAKNTL